MDEKTPKHLTESENLKDYVNLRGMLNFSLLQEGSVFENFRKNLKQIADKS